MIKTSREEENKSFHAAQARLQQMKKAGGMNTREAGQYYSALKAEGFDDAAATKAVFGLNPGNAFKPKKEE